ncbi:MAG: hypothetical protein SFW64_06945 [Alphaproteobacteria bacterium]|nr:hypothetical protein [Alphaproteobacteria bacterium]
MTRPYCMNILPPRSHFPWRGGVLAGLVALLSACGAMEYDIHEKSFFAPSAAQKDIAVIHFHYGDTGETYDAHVRRIHGGYGMQSSLYTNPDGDEAHVILSRTKARKSFIGIESHFSF